jgi:WD40 repeat protein
MMRSLLLAGLAVSIVGLALAAEPAKDALGDPVPSWAFARLGTDRMRITAFSNNLYLTPDGGHVIASVKGRQTLVDISTGLPSKILSRPRTTFSPVVDGLSDDGKVAYTSTPNGHDTWEFETCKPIQSFKVTTFNATPTGSFALFAALSADGKRIAAARANEKGKGLQVVVWDGDPKKEIAAVNVAQPQQCHLMLSDDGKTLVTHGPNRSIAKVKTTADALENTDRHIEIWDVEKGERRAILKNAGVAVVAISPDGSVLANASGQGEVTLWDAKTGKKLFDLVGNCDSTRLLRFSADGKTLAAVAVRGQAQLWNVAKGESISFTDSPVSGRDLRAFSARAFRFTGADRGIAVGTASEMTVAWEVPSGKVLSPTAGLKNRPVSVCFADGDREILTASHGFASVGRITRWNREGKELGTIRLRSSSDVGEENTPVELHPSGKVAYRFESLGLGYYDLPAGEQRFLWAVKGPTINFTTPNSGMTIQPGIEYRFSGDGKRVGFLASPPPEKRGDPYQFTLLDAEKGHKLGVFAFPRGEKFSSECLSHDGSKLFAFRQKASDKDDGDLALCAFELPSGKPIGEAALKRGSDMQKIAPSPDGRSLLVFEPSGKKSLYDAQTLQIKSDFELDRRFFPSRGNPFVFSADGARVAIVAGASMNGFEARIFRVADAKLLNTLNGHPSAITCMAFSNDGKTFSTGCTDTTILLWDVSKPTE